MKVRKVKISRWNNPWQQKGNRAAISKTRTSRSFIYHRMRLSRRSASASRKPPLQTWRLLSRHRHTCVVTLRDGFACVAEKLRDGLLQCYIVLRQLDRSNTLYHLPQRHAEWLF